MSVGLLDRQMAKKKGIPVKLHDDVVESARIVSALNGITMTDLLSDILRPVLAQMEQEGLARRAASFPAPKRKPKGE